MRRYVVLGDEGENEGEEFIERFLGVRVEVDEDFGSKVVIFVSTLLVFIVLFGEEEEEAIEGFKVSEYAIGWFR